MITAQMARDHATDVMAEWIGGYTEDPDGIEPQRRVRLEEDGEGMVVIRIEGARFTDERDRRFRIALTVEELA